MRRPDDEPLQTRATVEARARQDFPDADVAEIMAVLDRYGVRPHEREIPRVQMAILKLAAGDRDALEGEVETAKIDYRDVLAYAEFPAEMALGFAADGSNAQVARAREADKAQYREWWEKA